MAITATKNKQTYILRQEGLHFIFRHEGTYHGATGFHSSKDSIISDAKEKGYRVFNNGVEI